MAGILFSRATNPFCRGQRKMHLHVVSITFPRRARGEVDPLACQPLVVVLERGGGGESISRFIRSSGSDARVRRNLKHIFFIFRPNLKHILNLTWFRKYF
jgi:hypothetical protein